MPINYTLSNNGVIYATYMTDDASSSLANVSIGANDFAAMVRAELCRSNNFCHSGHPSRPTQ